MFEINSNMDDNNGNNNIILNKFIQDQQQEQEQEQQQQQQQQQSSSSAYSYSNDSDNESGDDDDDGNDILIESYNKGSNKRRKLSDEERLKRCRERNKVHAKNTREKKKCQMEALHLKIEQLTDEKIRLINEKSEKSVASILLNLAEDIGHDNNFNYSNNNNNTGNHKDIFESNKLNCNNISNAKDETMKILGRIRSQISSLLSDHDEFDNSLSPKLPKDRNLSSSDLDKLRRERNRLHAKKTRLRKKKMFQEMEVIVKTLQDDIKTLKEGHENIFSVINQNEKRFGLKLEEEM